MKKISDWVITNECAYRYYEGTDPEVIANRVAFIEKTPRIRIREAHFTEHIGHNEYPGKYDYLNWASGPFKGSGPDDEEARQWCDEALKLFNFKW